MSALQNIGRPSSYEIKDSDSRIGGATCAKNGKEHCSPVGQEFRPRETYFTACRVGLCDGLNGATLRAHL
jgi:hypothetical protein